MIFRKQLLWLLQKNHHTIPKKSIHKLADNFALVSPHFIRFARWISENLCGWGEIFFCLYKKIDIRPSKLKAGAIHWIKIIKIIMPTKICFSLKKIVWLTSY